MQYDHISPAKSINLYKPVTVSYLQLYARPRVKKMSLEAFSFSATWHVGTLKETQRPYPTYQSDSKRIKISNVLEHVKTTS